MNQNTSTVNIIEGLVERYISRPVRGSAILIGFSIPISVALDNLLLACVLLGVLFNIRSIGLVVIQHPVARAAWLLFGVLLFSISYGETPFREALSALLKYLDLLFIPLFILILSSDKSRRKAQHAFMLSMGITLLISYLVGWEILPTQSWMYSGASSDNPTIFHSHITQNNMLAFAVFLALLKCRDALLQRKRVLWGLFAILGGINVLFMVQGRTGYLILLVLLGWFTWTTLARYMQKRNKTWGWRQGLVMILIFACLSQIAYITSSRLHERVDLVASEYHTWQTHKNIDTSTGQRLHFYYHTGEIVQQNLLFGTGVGGFPAAFSRQVLEVDAKKTSNPHNQYLFIAAQTGIIGLLFLLYLFYTLWRCAPLLGTSFEQDAVRGLVLSYLINSAVNSALHDHSDGLFFAFMAAALCAGLKLERSITTKRYLRRR